MQPDVIAKRCRLVETCIAVDELERIKGPDVIGIVFESTIQNLLGCLLLPDAHQVGSKGSVGFPKSGIDLDRFLEKLHRLFVEALCDAKVPQLFEDFSIL